MEKPRIFLDTDVLINWIVKEVDKNTGFKLWRAYFPEKFLQLYFPEVFDGVKSDLY